MAVMSQMRDRSAVILVVLLVLFVLSMAIGGLVGGADIIDIITGRHGRKKEQVQRSSSGASAGNRKD